MTNDPRSWTEILIGVPILGAFAGIVLQQRRQVTTLQGSLETACKSLGEEREACGERLSLIETRMDREREDCDKRYRTLTSEFDDLRREFRRFTPREFPAAKEPGK